MKEFLLRYGAIKFVFNYNGDKIFTREFSFAEISILLANKEEIQEKQYLQNVGPPSPIRIEK